MFESQNFLFTAETTPDVSTDLAASAGRVDDLVGVADAINVTDSPNSKSRLSSLLVAAEIRRKGLDVILQLTGRDRNAIALESELLGALSAGVNKVLCLTGDQPPEGGPKAVNEFNGAGLIQLCNTLSQGTLSDGTPIKAAKTVYPGAADDIYQHLDNENAAAGLLRKIEDGAGFVQTQYCFDLDVIKAYAKKLSETPAFKDRKVLVGLGPLASAKQADWMRKNLWGVNISDDIVQRLEQSHEPLREGEAICEELIGELMQLPEIGGVHLMGPNCEKRSARIIARFRS